MTTVMRRRMPGMTGQAGSMARQLAGAGVLAGLLGGLRGRAPGYRVPAGPGSFHPEERNV